MTEYPHTRIRPVKEVHLPHVEEHLTSSGTPLYVLSGGTEPVLHLELIFSAGKIYEECRGAAHATAALLTDGTKSRSSLQIAQQIEHYGTTLRCTAGTDGIAISLYCMTRYLHEGLDILCDVLNEATFPDKELVQYRQKRLHNLKISLGQNAYVANRLLSGALFGDHPYGRATVEEHVRSLTRVDIERHYTFLGRCNLRCFVCGKVDDTHIAAISDALDRIKPGREVHSQPPPVVQRPQQIDLKGPQKHQAALRFGQAVVHRTHPDFPALFLLNTLAGGYFGSRLMKNIREDKGLTYNIYSAIETLVMSAYFVISTEANAGRTAEVMSEIRKELESLREELIPDAEIRMTKNYIMGNLMMSLDGPFRTMEVIKSMVMEGLPHDSFETFVAQVRETGSDELRNIARKYLDFERMHLIVVR